MAEKATSKRRNKKEKNVQDGRVIPGNPTDAEIDKAATRALARLRVSIEDKAHREKVCDLIARRARNAMTEGWWWKRPEHPTCIEEEFFLRGLLQLQHLKKTEHSKRKKLCRHAQLVPMDKTNPVCCRLVCLDCGSKKERHDFCAHRTELYRICCLHCNKTAYESKKDDESIKLVRYLSSRRKLRYMQNLCSLLLPVGPTTCRLIAEATEHVGIRSTSDVLHVTLLEGVQYTSDEHLEQVFGVLSQNPVCQITDVRTLPTTDERFLLVICSVECPLSWKQQIATIPVCLPQWPLHVALGKISASSASGPVIRTLQRSLNDQMLCTSPHQLAWMMAEKYQLPSI